MILEKTLQRIKNEIIDTFRHIQPVDRPGIAIIYNEENKSLVNSVAVFKEDCEEVNFNWFSTKVNSQTDPNFLRRIIRDYTEMDDVTNVIVLLPLPGIFKNIDKDITYMSQDNR